MKIEMEKNLIEFIDLNNENNVEMYGNGFSNITCLISHHLNIDESLIKESLTIKQKIKS